MCSELTPRAPIPDGRMAQIKQPCHQVGIATFALFRYTIRWVIRTATSKSWHCQNRFSYLCNIGTLVYLAIKMCLQMLATVSKKQVNFGGLKQNHLR